MDLSAPDVNAEQRRNIESTVAAIHDSGLKNIVLLSSWGAEPPEKSGSIIGCHWFERLLTEFRDLT